MSARDQIINMAVSTGRNPHQSRRAAEKLLDAYAHELAEELRSQLLPEEIDPYVPYNRTVRNLADLIDPEASS